MQVLRLPNQILSIRISMIPYTLFETDKKSTNTRAVGTSTYKCLKYMSTNILLMEEILHQLMGSLSHYLQGFIHFRWCRIPSINSISCIHRTKQIVMDNLYSCRTSIDKVNANEMTNCHTQPHLGPFFCEVEVFKEHQHTHGNLS